MKDLILDETTTIDSNHSNHVIKYIGIGVFVWLSIVTLAYTLKLVTKNALLMTTVEPAIVYGAMTIVEILAIIVMTLFAVRKISGIQLGDTRTVKSLFAKIVVLFTILTVMQFLISFYLPEIHSYSDVYMDSSEKYWDFIGGIDLMYIRTMVDFLPYLIVGVIFWRAK